jgi:LPXTG-motif cell wall-anchored protein
LSNAVPGETASITFTATASDDAGGQWQVETFQQSASNVQSSAGASATFVVVPPAPVTTTTLPGATPGGPTLSPSNPPAGLPATGPRDASTVVPLGIGFLAVGGLLISVTRRRPRRA